MQQESLARADRKMRRPPAAPVKVNTDKPFSVKPGALRGESSVIVKTHLAQRIVFGRQGGGKEGKRAVIGLVGFAGMLKNICTGAKLDDPYADFWLLKIEEAIAASEAEIANYRQQIEEALARRPDFTHKVAQSVEPLEVPLYFSNQIAFLGAYLINDFDNLVCAALTAKHVAVMKTVAADDIVRKAGKAVRRAFASANGYQYTGVSRADIAHGTAKAKVPLERWGELPIEVLAGTRRADSAPPLPKKTFAPQIAADHAEAVG